MCAKDWGFLKIEMWWQKKTDVVLLLKCPTLLSTGRVDVYIKYSKVHLKLFLIHVF